MPSEGKTPFRRHCRVCVPRRAAVFKPYAGTRARVSQIKSDPTAPKGQGFNRKGNTMKPYKIYTHPALPPQAVKQGWSWPGLLFGTLWACFKRMWGLGLGLTGAIFVLAVFAQLVYGDTPATDSAFNVLGLAVSVWFGAKGNSLYARHLLSRGYTELPETVEAANPQAALAQYFGRGGR